MRACVCACGRVSVQLWYPDDYITPVIDKPQGSHVHVASPNWTIHVGVLCRHHVLYICAVRDRELSCRLVALIAYTPSTCALSNSTELRIPSIISGTLDN